VIIRSKLLEAVAGILKEFMLELTRVDYQCHCNIHFKLLLDHVLDSKLFHSVLTVDSIPYR